MFGNVFLRDNWFSELAAEYVRRFFRLAALPGEAASFFFTLFLIEKVEDSCGDVGRTDRSAVPWQGMLDLYVENEEHSILKRR